MPALIARDFINDMVTETGKAAIAYPEVARRGVIEKLNASTAAARKRGWKVFFINIALDENCLPVDSQLRTALSEGGACQLGTPGVELAADVAHDPKDIVLRRYRLSAFHSALPNYIPPGELLCVCGVSTSLCVSSTVRDAFDRNYPVKIIEDACAAESRDIHEAEMQVLSMLAEPGSSETITQQPTAAVSPGHISGFRLQVAIAAATCHCCMLSAVAHRGCMYAICGVPDVGRGHRGVGSQGSEDRF